MKNQPTPVIPSHLGYWFGGVLCFVGILALSFGLAPFISSARKSLIPLKLPGRQNLELKLPGSYLAVVQSKNLPGETMQRIANLQFSLVDLKANESLEILKIPAKVYATDKAENTAPLFQFVVDKAGRYLLQSAYPYDLEGPSVQAFLIHTDLGTIRMELIVGAVLFLVLGGLGCYYIRKTYRFENQTN